MVVLFDVKVLEYLIGQLANLNIHETLIIHEFMENVCNINAVEHYCSLS